MDPWIASGCFLLGAGVGSLTTLVLLVRQIRRLKDLLQSAGNKFSNRRQRPPYSGKPIRVRSEVRNRNGYRYGVELVPEGEKERSEITRLCQMLTTFE
jgi:hypothetical protein